MARPLVCSLRPVRPMTLGSDIRRDLEFLRTVIPADDEVAARSLSVELALSSHEFDGVPVGSTLTDLLMSWFYRRQRRGGVSAAVRAVARRTFHSWRGVERGGERATGTSPVDGRLVLALISARDHVLSWAPRVVAHLGPERSHVVSDHPGLPAVLPAGTTSSRWDGGGALDLAGWRRDYRRYAAAVRPALRAVAREQDMTHAEVEMLRHSLLAATQRVRRYGAMIDRTRPAAIVVDYDRNSRGACLVLAARQRGVPTFTMVHGVVNGPWGFTPVLADRVLCWGELQRLQFIRFGTDAARIDVVGYERLEPGVGADRGEVRRRLGVDHEATVIVLATNPIEPSLQEPLVTAFAEGVSKVQGARGFVRLHPSESLTAYQSLQDRYPLIRFLANSELNHEETFALADAVAVHSSAFGSEALAKGSLCVVMDVIGLPLGHGAVLVEQAGAPRVEGPDDLARVLKGLRGDAEYRRGLQESADRFVRSAFSTLGDEACAEIARKVVSRTGLLPSRAPTGRGEGGEVKPEPLEEGVAP